MPMFVDFAPSKFASAVHTSGVRQERPDTTVCYHLLLYRDLLCSPCGEGTTFSPKRKPPPEYRASVDDVAKLPWWHGTGVNGGPVLSYDALLLRLWKSGIVHPYQQQGGDDDGCNSDSMVVPHEHWVSRLGFQEEDPSTDFRSGGLLGLACLVYICESRPDVRSRFAADDGDVAGILPLASTSINVTNMISDILMLKQSVESLESLLRPRRFWGVFLDPMALLVLHGICLDLLADIALEIKIERKTEMAEREKREEENEDAVPVHGGKISAFDFPLIMERTKRRIEDELLGEGSGGKGPTSINELRCNSQKLKRGYKESGVVSNEEDAGDCILQ
mmetsp:Transcript_2054/g.3542  ORF Transcript_2054/g.3542 Transcript_2054/m.3542 type:complete len:334 (-) Transcript_2054:90-1091(-)|eukprot:CAMPEP_0197451884 /NCGR_PEP_ID=MMETSP1175-20131217/30437_1 /TAXON_ID=1003142 /ORGANISM="Triceratium dubium, Strain CCMP147" /LENGTH=333 /DNA_ID=CAMNT_0042984747 /DNA_START=32 /DNA_END=1033 /DNA_ORIENTATION=+